MLESVKSKGCCTGLIKIGVDRDFGVQGMEDVKGATDGSSSALGM